MRKSWLEAADDRLCGREQAKAWALREVWWEGGKKPHGLHAFVARASSRFARRSVMPSGIQETAEQT